MKKKYKYIFVVLVYRNTDDVLDLIKSIEDKVSDFKIIIVNSFFDEKTKTIFKKIANNNNCDFLNIDNKGYGYGNNQGIKLAKNRYDFDYLIISNPDIEITKFTDKNLDDYQNCLVGPLVLTSRAKNQNPYWVIENKLCELAIYLGYKHRSRLLLYAGIAINKIIRESFLAWFTRSKNSFATVFALHGSFVIFPRNLLHRLPSAVYDEKIFLFSEEADLAHHLKEQKIKSFLTNDITVKHKEDGSMKLAKINEKGELRKSVLYYYAKHHRKKGIWRS